VYAEAHGIGDIAEGDDPRCPILAVVELDHFRGTNPHGDLVDLRPGCHSRLMIAIPFGDDADAIG